MKVAILAMESLPKRTRQKALPGPFLSRQHPLKGFSLKGSRLQLGIRFHLLRVDKQRLAMISRHYGVGLFDLANQIDTSGMTPSLELSVDKGVTDQFCQLRAHNPGSHG